MSKMFGRGLFGAIAFFLLAVSSFATTAVTGTLQNLGTGTVGQGAFVRFWLRGCGGNQPRVNGTAVIAPSQGGVFFFDLTANSSGAVSGTIYSTRDSTGLLGGDITCGVSTTSAWYGMQIFVGGKGGPEVAIHAKNGVSFDISSVTPINTNPVVVAPTGDSTYLRIDNGNGPATNEATKTGNNAFSGNNTHSGTETFTGAVTLGKWNSVITVDGTQFTTCDAAVTAATTQAGAGLALVIVPSTYVGAACTTIPTNNHVQVWYFNNIDPLVQSGVFWNTTSATPVHAMLRPQMNDASPVGNSLSVYAINRVSGVIPANSAMDAISPEVQSVGTIVSVGSGTVLQGSENVATLASTGGTWPDIRATVSYVRDIPSNTTNATNVSGLYIPPMTRTGTGVWTNVIGANFQKQTAGTNNYAAQFWGTTLFTFNAANEQLQISGDSFSNNNCLSLADTHAGGHTWFECENQNVAELDFQDRTQTGAPYWAFKVNGSAAFGGRLIHSNTALRDYSFQDASGTVTLTISSGTSTLTANAALAAVTSQAAITTAAANTLTTDAIEWSYATAPTAGDSLCHVSAYVTAGNVNFVRTNPTAAAQNVSALVINWRVIR